MNKNANIRGFTLLEIMVAISIMAIALTAIYKLHIQTIQMNIAARFHATAPLLAQRTISELELKDLAEVSSDSGTFSENFPGYSWRLTVEDVMESEILESVSERLKRIDVHISYNDDEYFYGFRTYRLLSE